LNPQTFLGTPLIFTVTVCRMKLLLLLLLLLPLLPAGFVSSAI
jgi:hypothetical protein